MEDNKNDKIRFLFGNKETDNETDVQQDSVSNKAEKLKKPLIFVLMGIVLLGCMYLIFKPSSDKQTTQEIGLNDAVPQARDAGLQPDKQKAYERDMLEQKMQEKRNALLSLSDDWSEDSTTDPEAEQPDEGYAYGGGTRRNSNPALNTYRNAQSTLTSFYDNSDYETQELRRQ